MKLKNLSKFHIKGLNQEKVLNEISKNAFMYDVERFEKNETTFKCEFKDYKNIEKMLKNRNFEIVSIKHEGILPAFLGLFTNIGMIVAVLLFFGLYIIQSPFILRYEIIGTDKLSKTEIVCFVKENFSNNKNKFETEDVEVSLLENFEQLSFASCIIKGQTLVINVKEKLAPEQMYGEFKPIVSDKFAKIIEINLVSGTSVVKVGDIVREGDVLVEPYTVDTSGNIKQVEAKATIKAEVYNEASVDHYESYIEVKRTGNVEVYNEISLFGLKIYDFNDDLDFEMYEVEYEEVNLSKNLFLPFKMTRTICYELKEEVITTKFEDVKEEYVAKAKEKVLENCANCDTIMDEFYTIRHLSGVTIVNYCVITLEEIGGYS